MSELGTFISSVGFPIALTCGLLYGIYIVIKLIINRIIKAFDTIIEAVQTLTKTNETVTKTSEELSRTNAMLVGELKNKINDIDKKLDKALDVL